MRPLIALSLLTLLLTACGQTGPLYLPEAEPPVAEPVPVAAPEETQAPAASSEAPVAGEAK